MGPPDGKTAYVTVTGSGYVALIDTATNTAIGVGVGNDPWGVANTPDGKTAYVTNFGSGSVTPIDTATDTAGAAIGVGSAPVAIAVTPDQGPEAAFSATVAPAGQASSFDASASRDPDGTVASHHWDFGDGTSQTTTSATTTHTYATPNPYTATLTVTDDAGCSTEQTFTGQTVSCNGSSVARVAEQVVVPAGYKIKAFGQPMNDPITGQPMSVFKAGSTVPVKFQLTDQNGSPLDDGDASAIASAVPCQATIAVTYLSASIGPVDETINSTTANSGNCFRYDPASKTFIFNLGTKGLPTGTFTVTANVTGSFAATHSVSVGLR